ncbi:hypothetical protein HY345_02520 [Candidatus Microgenomates bacterium]|nr:hypothetical protein [Candidatus Microgenomates bacterium]
MRFLKHYQGLILIIFLGLLLRLLFFREITFGYDMARDVLESISIWTTNHFKLIGPGTDIPGVEHGILWWYLISPFYFFSQGSVYLVKFILILASLLNICLIYYFSLQLFKNKTAALFSAFLFAVSFETISYARWVIHLNPALLTIGVTFLGMWFLWTKKSKGLLISLVGLFLSLHFEFFTLYLVPFVFLSIVFSFTKNRTKFLKKDLLLSLFSSVILLPFFLKELKYDFKTIRGLWDFAHRTGTDGSFFAKILTLPEKFIAKFSELFFYNFFSFDVLTIKILSISFLLLVLVSLVRSKTFRREKIFLIGWILSVNILYLLEGFGAYFISIGLVFPIFMLFSFLISEYIKRVKLQKAVYLFLGIIIFTSNLLLVFKHNPQGEFLFSIQKNNTLSNQFAVVDYLYQDAKGKPFKVNTLTVPLFINSVWAFDFEYYGKRKYGYMPQWAGYPQDGERVYGKEIVFAPYDENTTLFYLIIEPHEGIPEEYIKAFEKFENTRSKLISVKQIGTHTIQKRELFNNKIFLRDEVFVYSLEKD